MKTFYAAAIVILLAGCVPDPATTPDQSQAPAGTYVTSSNPLPSESSAPMISRPQTPVVVVPANKEISSQPTEVPKCEPVKAKKKVGVAKHVTPARHRHHHKKAVTVVAPNAAVMPKKTSDSIGDAAKDRCTQTGGWWNSAVPYCEYQMP